MNIGAGIDFRAPVLANGCHYYADCYTCPFSDCIWEPRFKRLKKEGQVKLRGWCPKHGNEGVKPGASFQTHDSQTPDAIRLTGEFECGATASLITTRQQAQGARAA